MMGDIVRLLCIAAVTTLVVSYRIFGSAFAIILERYQEYPKIINKNRVFLYIMIPRDVMSIVHKYTHRYNYQRCIDEFKRIYVPHFDQSVCYYNSPSICLRTGKSCPTVMFRQLYSARSTYKSIYKIFGAIRYNIYNAVTIRSINVAPLPKNY